MSSEGAELLNAVLEHPDMAGESCLNDSRLCQGLRRRSLWTGSSSEPGSFRSGARLRFWMGHLRSRPPILYKVSDSLRSSAIDRLYKSDRTSSRRLVISLGQPQFLMLGMTLQLPAQ